jgi:hypothetical protein
MEPSSVILTFHTIDGQETKESVTHHAPFHLLGPFRSATVRSINIGKRVALYGNVMKRVNGIFVQDYIHLREGNYIFSNAFHFLTMHADLLADPKKIQ